MPTCHCDRDRKATCKEHVSALLLPDFHRLESKCVRRMKKGYVFCPDGKLVQALGWDKRDFACMLQTAWSKKHHVYIYFLHQASFMKVLT